MMKCIAGSVLFFIPFILFSQDAPTVYKWTVSSKRLSFGEYELNFITKGNEKWQLYEPNQVLGGDPVTDIRFTDSSIQMVKPVEASGAGISIRSPIFNAPVYLFTNGTAWKFKIKFRDKIPATLQGTMLYTYGKGQEFYPATSFPFSVPLEGGIAATVRIKIPGIDILHPVNACGDENTADKNLLTIFILGFLGGLIALITPCVFPLIPLTVSFFTKKSGTRNKGIRNAFLYGLSIFLIYALLSVPFHLLNRLNPEVLNSISTNVWLNLAFFIIFIFFSLSFFGLYEIGLPSGFAGKVDSRAGLSDLWGIFFMALTLAIVSFSCTGPILGSLLAGALSANNGATQLTFGMSGFGLGLALPFALFALFPNWLQELPKSGGWLNSVKVVLGFLELALALKFLSNADLVKQWHLLKREVFIFLWIVIGFFIVLYLLGVIRFYREKLKFSKARIFFITLFSIICLYLIPGLTNTSLARLHLISGFPPPFSYSIYQHPVNYETGVEPLRDYDQAIALAKSQHKPVLIDFTGWACVNCRRMEENVWVNEKVKDIMKNKFVVVSLYVDDRRKLPVTDQISYKQKNGSEKPIITIGDKWSTFQSENFNSVSQPQYAIIGPDETVLTKTKGYTPEPAAFASWLNCGLNAFHQHNNK